MGFVVDRVVSGASLSPNAGFPVPDSPLIHICVSLRSGALGAFEPAVQNPNPFIQVKKRSAGKCWEPYSLREYCNTQNLCFDT
jgi:hypothetical protein